MFACELKPKTQNVFEARWESESPSDVCSEAEYWHDLHHTIRLTIHRSRYDYITIHYHTVHTAIFHTVH